MMGAVRAFLHLLKLVPDSQDDVFQSIKGSVVVLHRCANRVILTTAVVLRVRFVCLSFCRTAVHDARSGIRAELCAAGECAQHRSAAPADLCPRIQTLLLPVRL